MKSRLRHELVGTWGSDRVDKTLELVGGNIRRKAGDWPMIPKVFIARKGPQRVDILRDVCTLGGRR